MITVGVVRSARRWATRASALVILAGCSSSSTAPVLEARKLAIARQRWQVTAPASYEFTLRRVCFCGETATRSVVISVRGRQVVAAHFADDGTTVPSAWTFLALTIDDLFDRIADALSRPSPSVHVVYDGERGFPIEADLDIDQRVVDGGISYFVSGFHATN